MKRRFVAVALVLFLSLACLTAQNLKISVMDFSLESDNPQFKYLGKGFTELISVEVARLPGFTLVDRERRNAILEEQEFALSGVADESGAMEIGKLLSVDYFVVGLIIDMMGNLVVSYSIVRTDTGVVVGKLTTEGEPKDYKRMIKNIGVGIATMAGKETAIAKAQAAPPAPVPVAKQAEVLTSFSDAVAALDVKDVKTATAKLKEAQRIDPTDTAVRFYLDKLAAGSAKFKVVPERYVSYYNPAYLGGMSKDRLFYTQNYGWHTYGFPDENNVQLIARDEDNLWGAGERRNGVSFGYLYPISPRFGLGLECTVAQWKDSVVRDTVLPGLWYAQEGNQSWDYRTIMATGGLEINPRMSLGLGFSAGQEKREYFTQAQGLPYLNMESWVFGGLVAAVLRNAPGTLVWDVVASWSNEQLFWFNSDPAVFDFVEHSTPFYAEQTLTLVLAGGNVFLALKQANDVYFDRDLYYGRVMPIAEVWLFDLISLRAGIEGSVVMREGAAAYGWGATGGVSVKLWKIEADVNYTFRQRPARTLAEVVVPESVLFVTVSMNGILKN